jgi:nucleoside-diphosphate-sugar epimerase
VQEEFPDKPEIDIVVTSSNDNRSYHINSDKVYHALGFRPKYSIEDAIRGLCKAFRDGKIPNSVADDWYYNIRTMKKINAQ